VERLREANRPVGRDGAGLWRRMTASPRPLAIVELPVVRRLVEQGTIVIAAGGGGPPVYDDPLLGLEGVDAVVDKDRVAGILAAQLEAEVLMILTNVDAVFEGWGTPAEALIARGGLDEGGMKPKVEAAAAFARATGGRAIIARLVAGTAALRGETGTTITREP
jgi:carbamate kinase